MTDYGREFGVTRCKFTDATAQKATRQEGASPAMVVMGTTMTGLGPGCSRQRELGQGAGR